MILEILVIILILLSVCNRIAINNIGDRVFDLEVKDWEEAQFKKAKKKAKKGK